MTMTDEVFSFVNGFLVWLFREKKIVIAYRQSYGSYVLEVIFINIQHFNKYVS